MMLYEWSEHLLEISKIVLDPAIAEFESKGEWNAAAQYVYHKWMQNPASLCNLVASGTQIWYTLLLIEEIRSNPFSKSSSIELPHPDEMMVYLMEITRYGFEYFSAYAAFNAFFGYMIKVMPYFFQDYHGDYDGWYDRGVEMMKKSYQLAPRDEIAKAMYYEAIGDDMGYRTVCKQIWTNHTPEEWGSSMVQQYFFRVLNGDSYYPNAFAGL